MDLNHTLPYYRRVTPYPSNGVLFLFNNPSNNSHHIVLLVVFVLNVQRDFVWVQLMFDILELGVYDCLCVQQFGFDHLGYFLHCLVHVWSFSTFQGFTFLAVETESTHIFFDFKDENLYDWYDYLFDFIDVRFELKVNFWYVLIVSNFFDFIAEETLRHLEWIWTVGFVWVFGSELLYECDVIVGDFVHDLSQSLVHYVIDWRDLKFDLLRVNFKWFDSVFNYCMFNKWQIFKESALNVFYFLIIKIFKKFYILQMSAIFTLIFGIIKVTPWVKVHKSLLLFNPQCLQVPSHLVKNRQLILNLDLTLLKLPSQHRIRLDPIRPLPL